MEARSRNHCSRGKALSIKYIECVCVYSLPYLSGMQIGSSLRRITYNLWPVWLGQVFPHLVIGTTGGKKYLI